MITLLPALSAGTSTYLSWKSFKYCKWTLSLRICLTFTLWPYLPLSLSILFFKRESTVPSHSLHVHVRMHSTMEGYCVVRIKHVSSAHLPLHAKVTAQGPKAVSTHHKSFEQHFLTSGRGCAFKKADLQWSMNYSVLSLSSISSQGLRKDARSISWCEKWTYIFIAGHWYSQLTTVLVVYTVLNGWTDTTCL